MILYHGSKRDLNVLEAKQAAKADNIDVPQNELLDAIYLTPDYGFALACAARPEGVTRIDDDNKVITFDNPESFDPNETVYVYEVNAGSVPDEKIIKVDERQYAVTSVDKLEVSRKFQHKAVEVGKYYELKNWKEGEIENGPKMKFR